MSGPNRNPDKLNTIGIVVVGICGAVLVYVSIVALQAFYMNDSSEVQTMADYGGNDTGARSIRTSQIGNISEWGKNSANKGETPTFKTPIDVAMKQVVANAKASPHKLVPAVGASIVPSYKPIYGRPQPLDTTATPPPDGAGSAAPARAGSAAPAGAGSAAAPAGAGSATPRLRPARARRGPAEAGPATGSTSAPLTPTGQGGGGGAAPRGDAPSR